MRGQNSTNSSFVFKTKPYLSSYATRSSGIPGLSHERNYATMAHDKATKNHPGGIADVSSIERLARMYETDDVNDGYKALKLYMSKLNPKSESFFQYPRKNLSVDDNI